MTSKITEFPEWVLGRVYPVMSEEPKVLAYAVAHTETARDRW